MAFLQKTQPRGKKNYKKNCQELYVDVQETDGDRHFAGEGRIAINSIDLVLEASAKMAEEKCYWVRGFHCDGDDKAVSTRTTTRNYKVLPGPFYGSGRAPGRS